MLNAVDELSRPGVLFGCACLLTTSLTKGTHFVHFCAKASAWLSVAAAVGGLVACASGLDANQAGAGGTKAYIAVCHLHFRFCGCGVLAETKGGKIAAATGDSVSPGNQGRETIRGPCNCGLEASGDERGQGRRSSVAPSPFSSCRFPPRALKWCQDIRTRMRFGGCAW